MGPVGPVEPVRPVAPEGRAAIVNKGVQLMDEILIN